MEPRKMSGTDKMTVTIPEKLCDAIVAYIKLQHEYTNLPDFISCALKYFKMRYVYDIEPVIEKEIESKVKDGESVESVIFLSKFDGDSTSKQATIANGIEINLHGLMTQFPYLDYQNVKAYSVEFYYNAVMKSRDIYSSRYSKSLGYLDKNYVEDYSAPEIEFKCTYRKDKTD